MIKYIFIIPYRNREEQKHFFLKNMEHILEDFDKSTYEIIFANQNNSLPFNRGAMKNIGFLYAKNKYSYYKDITFIFNDIDTMPYKKGLLNYNILKNEIKHYYGFTFALGGIFAIKGEDFEKINGFPSFWSWGFEDNVLHDRALANHLYINRSEFYPLFNQNIIHILDSFSKLTSTKNRDLTIQKNVIDGLSTLKNVIYSVNENMLNISCFECSYPPNDTNLISNMDINTRSNTKPIYAKMFKNNL